MELYQRIDKAVARAESAMAVFVLLSMVLVASAQALFFNIAERNVGWAQSLLESLSWADVYLQKGTLWLAFLGASLATQQDKHIAIDIIQKLAKPRTQGLMRCFASLGAGVVAFMLASVFYDACLIADASIPFEYEVLTPEGPSHVCDAAQGDRPISLCALRALFGLIGIPVTSGGGIAQLVVPLMFLVIGVRLSMRALIVGISMARGQ